MENTRSNFMGWLFIITFITGVTLFLVAMGNPDKEFCLTCPIIPQANGLDSELQVTAFQ